MKNIVDKLKNNYIFVCIYVTYFLVAILFNPITKYDTINNYSYIKMLIVYSVFIGLIFVVGLFFIIFILEDKADEKMFLKIAIFLGLFFIIFTRFPHEFDENEHFFRTFLISKGNFYNTINDELVGGMMPTNYENIQKVSLAKILLEDAKLFTKEFSKERVFIANHYFCNKLPIVYIIPAIGMTLARIVNLSAFTSILFARLMVYIFYVTCSYFAIKNMKYYKKTMYSVCLIPVALWLAGTIHADPLLVGATLLFSSICLKYFLDDESEIVSKIDKILIILTAIFIITCKKFVYLPILLLFFLIPYKKFSKDKKIYFVYIIIAILIGSSIMIWQSFVDSKYLDPEDRNGYVEPVEQVKYILNNKLEASQTIINEMLRNSTIYLLDFGHYSYGINQSAVNLVAQSIGFILVINCILDNTKYNENTKKKNILNIILILLFILELALSIGAVYTFFTQVGSNVVQGYQPRYVVPIMLFILIPIANIINVDNNIKEYNKKLTFTMFIFNTDLIFALIVEMFNKLML